MEIKQQGWAIHPSSYLRPGCGGSSLNRATSSSLCGGTQRHSHSSRYNLSNLGLPQGLLLVGHAQNTSPKRFPGGFRVRCLSLILAEPPYPQEWFSLPLCVFFCCCLGKQLLWNCVILIINVFNLIHFWTSQTRMNGVFWMCRNLAKPHPSAVGFHPSPWFLFILLNSSLPLCFWMLI